MAYDVDFFIRKFEAIPEEKWTTGDTVNSIGQKCAYGHCGFLPNIGVRPIESIALGEIFSAHFGSHQKGTFCCDLSWHVVFINDGTDGGYGYRQPTPKQRILAVLEDIKKMQSEQKAQECDATESQSELLPPGTYPDLTKELAVLPIEERSDKENVLLSMGTNKD